LPNRKGVNATFISMLMTAGMTCAITNPLEAEIKQSIMAADALMGNDENCARWIQANAEGVSADRRRERQTGRRRRTAES